MRARPAERGDDADAEGRARHDLARHLPAFLWVLRDFVLSLEGQSPTQYLERILCDKPGFDTETRERNATRAFLRRAWKERACEVLVRQLQLAGAVARTPDGRVAARVDEPGLRYTLRRWRTLPRVVDGGPPEPTAHLYPTLTPVLADWMLPSHRVVARTVGRAGMYLLDLGGGMSPVGQLVVEAHPDARVTVVDRPEVLRVLAERLDGRADRFALLAGDLLVDPLPADADVVLLSGVLHLFDDDDVLRILRRAVRATVDGGTVAVAEPLLREDGEIDETITAYEIGLHLRHPQGGIWPYSRLAGWFARAGLSDIHRLALPGAGSLVVGTVGRPATDRT